LIDNLLDSMIDNFIGGKRGADAKADGPFPQGRGLSAV